MNIKAGTARLIMVIVALSIVLGMYLYTNYYFFKDEEESTGFNDYARITDIDYQAVLSDEPGNGGNVIITERITYDVHAASKDNLFWELYRDLPVDYVDGLKIDYKVNSVKQIYPSGEEVIYEESPKLYWFDEDYTSSIYGPGKWYHSPGYQCVLFYIDGIYRDEVTFEIEYVMYNAALRYSDVSELYLSMYSDSTIKYLESFKGEILIPNKDMPASGNYLAHTYGTNSSTFPFTESSTKNPGYYTFSFELDKDDLKFKGYNEYLEFSLLSFNEDSSIFTDYAPDNLYSDDVYLEEALAAINAYDDAYNSAKTNQKITLIITIVASLIIIVYVINRDKKIKKNYLIHKENNNIIYYRDIPSNLDPYFAATLVFSHHRHKVNMGDVYSALLLNLVRKNYIELKKIDETKNWVPENINVNILYIPNNIIPTLNNTTLNQAISDKNILEPKVVLEKRVNINGKELESLSINEETYFNLFIKYAINNTITMQAFQKKISTDINNTEKFVSSIEKSITDIGVSQGYFQKADYDKLKRTTNSLGNKYLISAILLLIIGSFVIYNKQVGFSFISLLILSITLIISGIILKHCSKQYVLLTEFGEDEYIKWRALYNFLNSATLMNEKEVVEVVLWEEYLVYATAFGIADKVIKALEIRCPDLSVSPMLNNQFYRSRNFITFNHRISRSSYRATYRSRGIHISGGAFYGGGGRGGGGGGGGH